MKHGFKGIVLITTICTGLLYAPVARADHATNFLDALHSAVTNRIANLDTNATQRERHAWSSVLSALERNTKTLSADLIALASAANLWETRLTNDAALNVLGNNALASFSAEADAQLDTAELHLGTNSISRGLSNQLAKARIALTNANANTNRVSARARALAQVFNKLRMPVAKVLKKYPTVPFEAPTEIVTGQSILLTEDAPVPQEQTTFYLHTTAPNGDRYLSYSSDNPEELGTWLYVRLTAKTAVIHANITFTGPDCGTPPGNAAPHDIALTFTSAKAGTFATVNCAGQTVNGTFSID